MIDEETVRIGDRRKDIVESDPLTILIEVSQQCDDLHDAYALLSVYATRIPGVTESVLRSILEYRATLVVKLPESLIATGKSIDPEVMKYVRNYAQSANEAIANKETNSPLRECLSIHTAGKHPNTNNGLKEVIRLLKHPKR